MKRRIIGFIHGYLDEHDKLKDKAIVIISGLKELDYATSVYLSTPDKFTMLQVYMLENANPWLTSWKKYRPRRKFLMIAEGTEGEDPKKLRKEFILIRNMIENIGLYVMIHLVSSSDLEKLINALNSAKTNPPERKNKPFQPIDFEEVHDGPDDDD